MGYLLPTFQAVSLIFAGSAIFTGVQAIVNPSGFAKSFGIPVIPSKNATESTSDSSISYISLMGARQLTTGITIVTFAYQQKWTEIATILSILGIVVAGTDGVYLWRAGNGGQARFHAIPGALISLLATAVVVRES